VYAAKAGGFFFIVFGVIVLIASLFTINPVWEYGPYDPSPISAGTQPDWYVGFADGMLRLIPPHLETYWLGRTWSWFIIIPLVILVAFLALVALYPFIEAWVTGDKREHHIADRPRNNATRTAIGAAGVAFYADMWAAASGDLIATHFKLSIEGVTHTIQILLIVGPIIAYWVTKRVCIALQKKDRSLALHGYESGRIVRLPGGEFIEVHQPVDEYDRWKLISQETYAPLVLRPDSRGRITFANRTRAALSRWFFEDRLAPLSQAELEAAAHHGHGTEAPAELEDAPVQH
jgi:ubiquinol-cytochrome c reductase cytochrome b subunit